MKAYIHRKAYIRREHLRRLKSGKIVKVRRTFIPPTTYTRNKFTSVGVAHITDVEKFLKSKVDDKKVKKATNDLVRWLRRNNIKFVRYGNQIEILEKPTSYWRRKIRHQVERIKEKHNLQGYLEGVGEFTFGFAPEIVTSKIRKKMIQKGEKK